MVPKTLPVAIAVICVVVGGVLAFEYSVMHVSRERPISVTGPFKNVAFKTVYWAPEDDGTWGAFHSFQGFLINDYSKWISILNNALCNGMVLSSCYSPSAESINFTSSTVIAAFFGQTDISGSIVNITQITETKSAFTVSVLLRIPNCGSTLPIENPFHIVSIPNTQLNVTFVETVSHYNCGRAVR